MTALRRLLVPVLLVSLITGPATSQPSGQITAPQTVADLLSDCRAALTHPRASASILGVKGWQCSLMAPTYGVILLSNCEVLQGGEALVDGGSALAGQAARPPGPAAAIQAFVTWAEAHPERGSEPAGDGFIAAMMEAFPCLP